jgi:hypothetical protein
MTIPMAVAVPTAALVLLGVPGASVLLRYRFAPNQELRYHLHLSMETRMEAEGKLQLVAPVNTGEGAWVLRVLHVRKDGSAVLSSSVTGLRMRMGAGAVAEPETATFALSPSGRLDPMRTPGSKRTFRDLAAIARISTALPLGKVHAGSTWSFLMPSPVWGEGTVRVAGKVARIFGQPGGRVAVLQQRFQFPIRLVLPASNDNGARPEQWNAQGTFTVVSFTKFGIDKGIPVATEVTARGIVAVSPVDRTHENGGASRLHILVRASTGLQR